MLCRCTLHICGVSNKSLPTVCTSSFCISALISTAVLQLHYTIAVLTEVLMVAVHLVDKYFRLSGTQPSHSLPAATSFTGEGHLLYAQSPCAWLTHKLSYMVRMHTCPRASRSPAAPFASSWQHSSTCNTEATVIKVVRTAPMHAHTHDHA